MAWVVCSLLLMFRLDVIYFQTDTRHHMIIQLSRLAANDISFLTSPEGVNHRVRLLKISEILNKLRVKMLIGSLASQTVDQWAYSSARQSLSCQCLKCQDINHRAPYRCSKANYRHYDNFCDRREVTGYPYTFQLNEAIRAVTARLWAGS